MQDIGIVTMTDHSTAPFFINVIEPQLGLNVTAIFEVFCCQLSFHLLHSILGILINNFPTEWFVGYCVEVPYTVIQKKVTIK